MAHDLRLPAEPLLHDVLVVDHVHRHLLERDHGVLPDAPEIREGDAPAQPAARRLGLLDLLLGLAAPQQILHREQHLEQLLAFVGDVVEPLLLVEPVPRHLVLRGRELVAQRRQLIVEVQVVVLQLLHVAREVVTRRFERALRLPLVVAQIAVRVLQRPVPREQVLDLAILLRRRVDDAVQVLLVLAQVLCLLLHLHLVLLLPLELRLELDDLRLLHQPLLLLIPCALLRAVLLALVLLQKFLEL
mmetsp:Transcript_13740/g.40618  ORF Transcript_13740/g.40618 Transcript_13740/m.40618 type:complete len:245 (+) Transcript_13740:1377-2111(+)